MALLAAFTWVWMASAEPRYRFLESARLHDMSLSPAGDYMVYVYHSDRDYSKVSGEVSKEIGWSKDDIGGYRDKAAFFMGSGSRNRHQMSFQKEGIAVYVDARQEWPSYSVELPSKITVVRGATGADSLRVWLYKLLRRRP